MADLIFPGEAPQGDVGITRLPQNVDFSMWQGDAQLFYIRLTSQEDNSPVDLAGSTAQAVLRSSFTSPTSYPFTCTIQNMNEVKVYMSSEDADAIPAGDYVWNFQITNSDGDVRTYLAGDVKIYAQVD